MRFPTRRECAWGAISVLLSAFAGSSLALYTTDSSIDLGDVQVRSPNPETVWVLDTRTPEQRLSLEEKVSVLAVQAVMFMNESPFYRYRYLRDSRNLKLYEEAESQDDKNRVLFNHFHTRLCDLLADKPELLDLLPIKGEHSEQFIYKIAADIYKQHPGWVFERYESKVNAELTGYFALVCKENNILLTGKKEHEQVSQVLAELAIKLMPLFVARDMSWIFGVSPDPIQDNIDDIMYDVIEASVYEGILGSFVENMLKAIKEGQEVELSSALLDGPHFS